MDHHFSFLPSTTWWTSLRNLLGRNRVFEMPIPAHNLITQISFLIKNQKIIHFCIYHTQTHSVQFWSGLDLKEYWCWYTANIVNISNFNALSIGSGPVLAELLCMKRDNDKGVQFMSRHFSRTSHIYSLIDWYWNTATDIVSLYTMHWSLGLFWLAVFRDGGSTLCIKLNRAYRYWGVSLHNDLIQWRRIGTT